MGCCVCLFDSSHPPPACPFCFSDYTYHSEEEVEENDMMVEKEKGRAKVGRRRRRDMGVSGWVGGLVKIKDPG